MQSNYGSPFFPGGFSGQMNQMQQSMQSTMRQLQQQNLHNARQSMTASTPIPTSAAFPVVRRFNEPPFYQSNTYTDMVHAATINSIAMHSQELHDRNDSKPRLAKQEVDLLERHFQENHKPPSSLKRQLADGMGVQVSRINVSD